MPPAPGKRRAPVDDDPAPSQTRRRRQRDVADEIEEEEATQYDEAANMTQWSKGLVRYALACDHKRIPIKRQDVNARILGPHSREFKKVFDEADAQLMDVFGMRMVELPNREKVTLRQRRAAAATESQSKSSQAWVLENVLPEQYRIPEIIAPSHTVPPDEPDPQAAYVGLYTMILALISISGGQLSEGRLDRHLRRLNANMSTPVGTTDQLLKDMQKDGYIVKIRDNGAGEETIDYIMGPRGKVEVGKEGVARFVKGIVGDSVADIDQRLARTLELGDDGGRAAGADGGEGEVTGGGAGAGGGEEGAAPPSTKRRRGRPRRAEAHAVDD